MLGRVLFTFVWLIIAAGLVLPLYPGEEAISVVTAASDPVRQVAASEAFGCEDCPVADDRADCSADCPCDPLVPAVFVPLEDGVGMTLAGSARLPVKLPAKLPAI
jgi:hypothetical protein